MRIVSEKGGAELPQILNTNKTHIGSEPRYFDGVDKIRIKEKEDYSGELIILLLSESELYICTYLPT
jgi:hypothetical protein